jgi:hypothetical protein
MSPEAIIALVTLTLTLIGMPLFNYLNESKKAIIKNDILSSLSTETNKIKDKINLNSSDIKALRNENIAAIRSLRAEMKYMLKTLDNRLDGIERYLEKINGFVPSSGDTKNSRSED